MPFARGLQRWIVTISRRRVAAVPGIGSTTISRWHVMNASEEMYFGGAPLAHVVRYEELQRTKRWQEALRDAARLRTSGRAAKARTMLIGPGLQQAFDPNGPRWRALQRSTQGPQST